MKKYLKEEDYNQVVKIGEVFDNVKGEKVVKKLQEMGIDAYIKNNELFVMSERDMQDAHYVDDVVKTAKDVFSRICGGNKMKLACSKSTTLKLTESKLKQIIKESVRKVLSESDEFFAEEKQLCTELANFLQKNGVKSADVGQMPSGLPVVRVDTNEYFSKKADSIADKFAASRKMYISTQDYPATTYLRLNRL